MEVSALKYSGGIGLHGRSPLLRLQSDERLVALVRRGNSAAFETLVARYESRLLSFCRHLLGSREDAEDVLQDVMAAAYNAMRADERSINVRPWLYRIARNRSLNHMRRVQALPSETMDTHLHDHGATTADKVHEREEFRLLVGDIHSLPETQRTALVLREMDALSYEQIAEAMETTVPSVKSLLVRARVSLAEAAEARLLSCEAVRTQLAEIVEGLQRRPDPLARRHLKTCSRCRTFQVQLKETNRALAVLLPVGPLIILKKLALAHLGHSAGSGATSAGAAAGGTAAGGTVAGGSVAGGTVAGGTAAVSSVAGGALGSGGLLSAGIGALATKAAAGLAAAALVTAGAVEVDPSTPRVKPATPSPALGARTPASAPVAASPAAPLPASRVSAVHSAARHLHKALTHPQAATPTTTATTPTTTTPKPTTTTPAANPATPPGRSDTTTAPTVLPATEAGTAPATGASTVAEPTTTTDAPASSTSTTSSTTPSGTTTTSSSTTPTDTTTSSSTSTTPDSATSTTPGTSPTPGS